MVVDAARSFPGCSADLRLPMYVAFAPRDGSALGAGGPPGA
jgi:hypothetical protein